MGIGTLLSFLFSAHSHKTGVVAQTILDLITKLLTKDPMIQPLKELKRVYCAGALFNASERREMELIGDALIAQGFDVFVPHRDGMEFAEVHPYLIDKGFDPIEIGQLIHEVIFGLDVYQVILGCGSLVFNLNGRVPDEGAVSETAMAWAFGKPLVIYKDDVRSKISGRDNPLVVGLSDFETISSIEEIPIQLSEKISKLQIDSKIEYPCSPDLEKVLARGEKLWIHLVDLGDERPTDQVAEIILDLFGA